MDIKDVDLLETIDLLEKIEVSKPQNIKEEKDKIKKEGKSQNRVKQSSPKIKAVFKNIFFLIKYSLTSILIFFVLLLTTNYSAYLNIAKGYFYEDKLEEEAEYMINSVEAWSSIDEKTDEEKIDEEEVRKEEKENNEIKLKDFKQEEIKEENNQKVLHSINKLITKSNDKDIKLDIDITPYENRVIIPKIWKNIPLIEVENREVEWMKELNNIFLKELTNGIIRYPWSWIPWEKWNSFIFWHSSNFPWIKWDYNDVFALLDKLEKDDEIIIYYGQKKFKYKIREKKVVKPSNVEVLKKQEDKSEVTFMTCWPVWTTLNRLIVVWDLVE